MSVSAPRVVGVFEMARFDGGKSRCKRNGSGAKLVRPDLFTLARQPCPSFQAIILGIRDQLGPKGTLPRASNSTRQAQSPRHAAFTDYIRSRDLGKEA